MRLIRPSLERRTLAKAGALIAALVLFAILAPPSSAAPQTYVVNSTGDAADANPADGVCDTGFTNSQGATECTLRAALEESEGNSGNDSIEFNMPTSEAGHAAGLWTIVPGSDLPTITETVSIDGSTQPGFIPNTAPAPAGLNGTQAVHIRPNSPTNVFVVDVTAPGTIIHGLVVSTSFGLSLDGSGVTLTGSYVGTNASGTAAESLNSNPINASNGVIIGGTDPADRNLIVGSTPFFLSGPDNVVQGNLIGTNASGTVAFANPARTIVARSNNNLIGGIVPGSANVISGGGSGINVDGGSGTSILGNRIVGNATPGQPGLGIDLSPENAADGPTANDPGDTDAGSNDYLNFPEIMSAVEAAGTVTVNFTLDSPAGTYRIEAFTNPSGIDPSGYGEGEVFETATSITHAGAGSQAFQLSYSGSSSDSVTLTTTEDMGGGTFGSTSEFSLAATVGQGAVTVNSTGDAADSTPGDDICDTGATNSAGATECTLRAALDEANASATTDTIFFNMPTTEAGHSAGVWTIAPATALPTIVQPATIDGATQGPDPDAVYVVLDGTASGVGVRGLHFTGGAPGSQLSSLSITRFTGEGVYLDADGVLVTKNVIGVLPDGVTAAGNGTEGVHVEGDNSVIHDNLIGGHADAGISISNFANNTTVTGNIIGTDETGTVDLANSQAVWLDTTGEATIGGTGPLDGNTIAFNRFHAIDITSAGSNVTVLGNSIFNNGFLAINHFTVGEPWPYVDTNDAGDGDAGPNDLLNYPVITAATEAAGTVTVDFDLDVPAGSYRIEAFTNPSGADPAGYGEGEKFEGAVFITHTGTGLEPFQISYSGAINNIALTATVDSGGGSYGATSEFSATANSFDEVAVNSTGDASDATPGDGVCDTGNTNSAGATECTLRAAIEEVNASASVDTINFDMPSTEAGHASGVWTITTSSSLPPISRAVTIDGSTQTGFVANTNTAPLGLNGTQVVEISAGSNIYELFRLSGANGTVLHGLVVNSGWRALLGSGVTITGSYLGTDPTGTVARPGGNHVLSLNGDSRIGGTAPADRNLISGHGSSVSLQGDNSVVEGNIMGLDFSGTTTLGSQTRNIHLRGSSNTIGGVTPGSANLIGGDGTGVVVDSGSNNAILGNSIFGNTISVGDPAYNGVGIDIAPTINSPDGVTVNDPGDGDSGPNDLLNFPVITGVGEAAGTVTVDFDLDVPAGSYRIEAFTNPSGADPTGYGEGQTFQTATAITHTGTGLESFQLSYTGPADAISLTTTDDLGGGTYGSTSEFSQTFTAATSVIVNSTGDAPDTNPGDGTCDTGATNSAGATECTLRAAIEEANASAAVAAIEFAIPTTEIGYATSPLGFTITPALALPDITSALTIDGTTQAEWVGVERPVIELDGTASGGVDGLSFSTGTYEVRGLAIGNFARMGIHAPTTTTGTIAGNYIGVDLDGVTPRGNGNHGLNLTGSNITVGGLGPNDGNVISDNTNRGIRLSASLSTVNVIGNYIGTDASGNAPMGNGLSGIIITGSAPSDVVIGGSTPGAANVIGGNGSDGIGIQLGGPGDITITGNSIGIGADGSTAVGNVQAGIAMYLGGAGTRIGGAGAGEGNRIANNGTDGIEHTGDAGVSILGNEIRDNVDHGIDVGNDGTTANDAPDSDGVRNYPVITSVIDTAGTITVNFDLDVPAGSYRIEAFTNPSGADPTGHGEGETFQTATTITHTGTGLESFQLSYTGPADAISLTTTDDLGGGTYGSTSEFSETVSASTSVTVNSTGDASDTTPGNGVCDTGNTNSAGATECTLRAAIEEANASAAVAAIEFAIPTTEAGHSAGIWTIAPLGPFDDISGTVRIDGSTQPGFASTPLVQIDGSATTNVAGLILLASASDSEIRSLAIGNYDENAIFIYGDRNVIAGNHLGLNALGTSELPIGAAAVVNVEGGADNTIGGLTALDRNVITSGDNAIVVDAAASTTISGNYIGTDVTGSAALGTVRFDGIRVQDASTGTVIGGPSPAAGNVIGFVRSQGIDLRGFGTANTTIQNNVIGIGSDGSAPLPIGQEAIAVSSLTSDASILDNVLGNTSFGIRVMASSSDIRIRRNTLGTDGTLTADHGMSLSPISVDNGSSQIVIGGPNAGDGNQIRFVPERTPAIAVSSFSTDDVAILGNSIVSPELPIDLNADGPTANDTLDADVGPNDLMNHPELTVTAYGTADGINYTVDVDVEVDLQAGNYRIEIFENDVVGYNGVGSMERFVHGFTISHPGGGSQTFSTTYSGLFPSAISATTTEEFGGGAYGSTSEMSPPDVSNITTVIVNSTGDAADADLLNRACDTGALNSEGLPECTLRAAIEQTNRDASATIAFAIPVSDARYDADGYWTIPQSSDYEDLRAATTIDGSTQPGFDGSRPLIFIRDNGTGTNHFTIAANDVTMRSLSLGNPGDDSVEVDADRALLDDLWIGIAPDGSIDGGLGGGREGIILYNGSDDLLLRDSRISGFDTGISSNSGTMTATVTGTEIFGNRNAGILFNNAGTLSLLGNSLHDNGGLGFELADNDGLPLPNDPGDADGGANEGLNYPVLTVTSIGATTIDLDYELDLPAGTYRVEFFDSTRPDPTLFGEGETLRLAAGVVHPGGSATYSVTLPASAGDVITATATIDLGGGIYGATSEFSAVASVGQVYVNSTGDGVDATPGDGDCDTGALNSDGLPECTLRAAIEEANASALIDIILFLVPTGDPGYNGVNSWTITPASALPAITAAVTVDGTTQPGTLPNNNPSPLGFNGTLTIEIDGSLAGAGASGLHLQSPTVIRGLAITSFAEDGVWIDAGASGSEVRGSYIGVDVAGTVAAGNGDAGIEVGATSARIGGPLPADRNVISSNGTGVRINGVDDAEIIDNLIGLAADGTTPLANGTGIDADTATSTTISGNVVSGNTANGLAIQNGTYVITGNVIGVDALGAAAGNGLAGIDISVGAGPGSVIATNEIAHNGADGVSATSTGTVSIVANSIHDNVGLAIDIDADGVTSNDSPEADGVVNYPTFTELNVNAGTATARFDLDAPAGDYRIEFYSNTAADPSGNGEAETLIDSTTITHTGGGLESFVHSFAATTGQLVSATATVELAPATYGATSEVSLIAEVNTAPTFDTDIPSLTHAEGAAISIAGTATDADLDALVYTATGLPSGVVYNAGTGQLVGTISTTAAAGSPYAVTLTVDDGNGGTDVDTFTWTVTNTNQAPTITAVGDATHDELTAITFTANATDPDLPADTVTYSATGLPSGATLSPTTGAFAWTPTEAQGPDSYAITITATDDGSPNLSDSTAFTLTIDETRSDPVLAPIGNQASGEGSAISVDTPATDSDLPADTLIWSATNLPTGLSINAATGEIAGTIDPTAGFGSPYPVTITVDDQNGGTDSETLTWTIADTNRNPTLAPIASRTISELIGTTITALATDDDLPADTVAYSATGLPPGASMNPSTGTITVVPLESNGPGSYTIVVTATDDGTPALSDSTSFVLTIDEVNAAPVLNSIPDFAVNEQSPVALTFAASDIDRPFNTLTFSAVGLPAGATLNPTTGDFAWTPTEADGPGAVTMTVTVTDDGTPPRSAATTLTITVDEVNEAPVFIPMSSRSEIEADAVDFSVIATDADLPASPLTYAATGLPPGLALDSATGRITGVPTYDAADGSPHTVIVTASDGVGGLSTEQFLLSIVNTNRAPSLQPANNTTISELSTLSLTISATDPDNDGLVYRLDSAPDGMTIDPNSGEIRWATSEADGPGTYAVDVLVTDTDRRAPLSDSQRIQIVVNEVNSSPTLATPSEKLAAASEEFRFGITAGDVDRPRDSLTFSIVDGPEGLEIDPLTGVIRWTPDIELIRTVHDVTVRVSDDGSPSLSDLATFTIEVLPPSLAFADITATGDSFTVVFNSSTRLDVLRNDDGDALMLSDLTQPEDGTVAISQGEVNFRPDPDFIGVTSFEYTIVSADGGSATAAVTVNVERPGLIANDDDALATAGKPVLIDVLINDLVDSSVTELTLGEPANGEVIRTETGELEYRSTDEFRGEDQFLYTLTDQFGTVRSATVRIQVIGPALTPTAQSLVSFDIAEPEIRVVPPSAVSVRGLVPLIMQAVRALQLPTQLVTIAGVWMLLFVFAVGRFQRRSTVQLVTNADRGTTVPVYSNDLSDEIFQLRHDADLICAAGRRVRRKGEWYQRIESPVGPGLVSVKYLEEMNDSYLA